MQNILVISPIASHPLQNVARRRIHRVLSALKAQDHRIHFVYIAGEDPDIDRVQSLMEQDWDSVDVVASDHDFDWLADGEGGIDRWTDQTVGNTIAELAETYEATHCLLNSIVHTRYFEFLPAGVVKILDTNDRPGRRAIFAGLGTEPGFHDISEAEEMRGLGRADVVLATHDNEVECFLQAGKPVVVVGHMMSFKPVEKRFISFNRLGFLGTRTKFNIHALEQFIPAFAAYAAELEEDVTISVAGDVADHFAHQPEFQFDCVHYDGFVPEIGTYFKNIDLFVNPVFVGAGLRAKSVEALSYGMPVVSTTFGWEGLLPIPKFHDIEDVDGLIAAIDSIRGEGFEALTRLANFAKASFTEYQLNLDRNLHNLFSLPSDKMMEWAERHPGYIGSLQTQNPDFITLDSAPLPPTVPRPSIAHIVNPVRLPKTSDLYIAQPIAFHSMRRAQVATTAADVRLVARRYPEDSDYLKDCFDINLPLERSAQDLNISPVARKLPLLADVFSFSGLPEDVTHLVYTNSDIGLQPHFYDFVADRIAEGHDALVINRRTLPRHFSRSTELTRIYANSGQKHPGFDCFVVSRAILARSFFSETLIGVHLIGRVVFWNLLARAQKIGYFDEEHLTFHIGDDVPSKGRSGQPYIRHNLEQGAAVARALRDDPGRMDDPSRIARFARVLHVSPGEIQGPFNPKTMPRKKVLMHSLFRTGSTYLFQKVRNQKTWTGYYEPFHEELAQFSLARLVHFREQHANSKYHHAGGKNPDQWLFAEYEPLLEPGCIGVRGYDRRMSYLPDYDGADAAIQGYVQGLTDAAQTENVFFQFNRTALRQVQMRALFPDDYQIYLRRNLRDVWGSYLTFSEKAVYGFMRNNLVFLNFNAEHPLARELSEHVPVCPGNFSWFFHSRFNAIFQYYTLEQHFLIHATFWYAAQAQAEECADFIVDLDALASDRLLRLETEATLSAQGMDLSFSDIAIHSYDADDLLLSKARMEQLEALARGIVTLANSKSGAGQGGAPVVPASVTLSQTEEELRRILERQDERRKENFCQILHKRRTEHVSDCHSAPALKAGRFGAQQMEQLGLLAFGFHAPERYHVWASGSYAMLRFALPDICETMVTLRLHSHPTMVERYQETLIFLNGELREECRLGNTWEIRTIPVTRRMAEQNGGIVEIGFVVPHFFDGREARGRALSLCLSQIEIAPARRPQVTVNEGRTADSTVHGAAFAEKE